MFRNLTLVVLTAAMTLSAADSFVGTWKLNIAKSKYAPGPAPKSLTATYTQDGDWINLKNEGVDAEGKPTSFTLRFKRDGKEYPYTTDTGAQSTIAIKLIDARTNESTQKIGTATFTLRNVLAANGKTFTRTVTGTNAKGQKVKNVMVFEKQ